MVFNFAVLGYPSHVGLKTTEIGQGVSCLQDSPFALKTQVRLQLETVCTTANI